MILLLNSISVSATFVVVFSVLYFIQRITIGFFPIFKKTMKNFSELTIGNVTFSVTSIILIITSFDFYLPY